MPAPSGLRKLLNGKRGAARWNPALAVGWVAGLPNCTYRATAGYQARAHTQGMSRPRRAEHQSANIDRQTTETDDWMPTPGFTPRKLSPEAEREVQAILDAAARRILEQKLREAGLVGELDPVEPLATRRRRLHQHARHQ